MKAINYCHSNKICHRDLKPENFLFLTKDKDSPVKVIDFGLSKIFEEDGLVQSKAKLEKKVKRKPKKVIMKTRAGTPYYIAPEVLTGSYNETCDIWSAGVILYILLCGYPPFFGDNDQEILDSVRKGYFDFDGPEWVYVSEEAKHLIR